MKPTSLVPLTPLFKVWLVKVGVWCRVVNLQQVKLRILGISHRKPTHKKWFDAIITSWTKLNSDFCAHMRSLLWEICQKLTKTSPEGDLPWCWNSPCSPAPPLANEVLQKRSQKHGINIVLSFQHLPWQSGITVGKSPWEYALFSGSATPRGTRPGKTKSFPGRSTTCECGEGYVIFCLLGYINQFVLL